MPTRASADEPLALALATGATVEGAAAAAGVSVGTVYRRLRLPEFRALVQARREQLLGQAAGKLAGGGGKAADVLVGLLDSGNEKVKLNAARAVLEFMTRLAELIDVLGRMGKAEEQLKALAESLHELQATSTAAGTIASTNGRI